MKINISEAARLSGISRQHFYKKYVDTGLLSIDRSNSTKPVVDVSELLRVFPGIKLPDSRLDSTRQDMTQELIQQVTALQKDLTTTRQQLIDSQDREKWLQHTVNNLTDSLKLISHKQDSQELNQGHNQEPKKVSWWRKKLW